MDSMSRAKRGSFQQKKKKSAFYGTILASESTLLLGREVALVRKLVEFYIVRRCTLDL